MISDRLLVQLRLEFLAQVDEQIELCTQFIISFEPSGEATKLDGLQRTVHSLKGSVQFVQFQEASHLLHTFEDWMESRWNRNHAIQPQKFDIDHALTFFDELREYFKDLNTEGKNESRAQNLLQLLSA